MNILYISQFFTNRSGGGEAVIYNLAMAMHKRGHKVNVICQRLKDHKSEDTGLKGLSIDRIEPQVEYAGETSRSISNNMLFILNTTIRGMKVIKKNRVELIHANFYGPAIAGSILSRFYNIPLVKTVHHIYIPEYWKQYREKNRAPYYSSVAGRLFQKLYLMTPVDRIHSVSAATSTDLHQYGIKWPMQIIPNGIDISEYDNYFENEYAQYILFIGRLVFHKNLEVVIASFVEVQARFPSSKLIIVGTGPMEAELRAMVARLGLKDNIQFAGGIDHKEKLELLSKCTAVVLPSLVEGFGLVLLEAFAMRKPVLVSNIGALPEMVNEGFDGYILPPYDSHEWSRKILLLLSDQRMCKSMGERGRQKVEKKYNLNHISDLMESLYLEVKAKR
jgi:glycosyltransferase involved in cell wall biosynthesis